MRVLLTAHERRVVAGIAGLCCREERGKGSDRGLWEFVARPGGFDAGDVA